VFRPIAVLLLILGIAVVIAAAQPSNEPSPVQSPTATEADGDAVHRNRLLAGLEAGGSALATAAEAAFAQAQAEAMGLLLAKGAPFISEWIGSAREAALARGTEAIPADIRSQLRKFYPDVLLKTVRWRVGLSADGSLPARLFEAYGRAVTLGNVIVFRDEETARDPVIWAHEVAHVQQYQRWGIDGFAQRYVENYRAVEREAWDLTGDWAKRQGDPVPP
jgi:hypothetical protein